MRRKKIPKNELNRKLDREFALMFVLLSPFIAFIIALWLLIIFA